MIIYEKDIREKEKERDRDKVKREKGIEKRKMSFRNPGHHNSGHPG